MFRTMIGSSETWVRTKTVTTHLFMWKPISWAVIRLNHCVGGHCLALQKRTSQLKFYSLLITLKTPCLSPNSLF